MLGSQRATSDIDIVVPTGKTSQVAQLLNQYDAKIFPQRDGLSSNFSVAWVDSQGKKHVVDIIEPQEIQKSDFFKNKLQKVAGYSAPIPSPKLLLELKQISKHSRGSSSKGPTDAMDIKFLEKLLEEQEKKSQSSGNSGSTSKNAASSAGKK
ncbi:hypothetical protein VTH82DRAFT_1611 [Thermothelomyces myriococcoides]